MRTSRAASVSLPTSLLLAAVLVGSLLGSMVWVGTSARAASPLGAAPGAGPSAGPRAASSAAPVRYHQWAPAATARIHPGSQLITGAEQCTANFVFTDSRGDVYLGYAAHCAGTGGQSETDGCRTGSVPIGTKVRVATGVGPTSDGTTVGTGRLAYSSWITMHKLRTKDADTCGYNDFALVRLDRQHRGRTNPSVPEFGGPTRLATAPPGLGSAVLSWGQSSLRPTTLLSAKRGRSLGSSNSWSTSAYTLTPGIPGDSGSGFLDASGRAFGVLSTVALTPLPASNGIGSLPRELAFARAHSGLKGLALAAGTVRFTG